MTRDDARKTMVFSLGVQIGSFIVDAAALCINGIVLARNVVRATTAWTYSKAVEIRGRP